MKFVDNDLGALISQVQEEINWLQLNQPYWFKRAFDKEFDTLYSVLYNLIDIEKELEGYRRPAMPVRDPMDRYY